MIRVTIGLALFAFPVSLAASEQPVSPVASEQPRPEIRATAVSIEPTIDGIVAEDPAWQSARPATGFWQTEPSDGEPASERTEVRVVFTQDTLYFGVICYDDEPDRLVVSDTRRDSSLSSSDSFLLILDTFGDGQNGFLFGTNPAGIEYDVQVSGSSGGRRSGYNLDWNTSWKVAAEVGDYGWSAELAIPFRSLRYPGADRQTWGVNFERGIARKNERAYWAQLDRQYRLSRVSEAGTLVGLEPPKQRNLSLTPYALGQASDTASTSNSADPGTDSELDGGLDVKYAVTPSLVLDATYNTDFAQVEADDQQINLNRFNLFFPEKRPFFLENAGLFSVGSPGSVDLFFSRRIGISQGQAIPILGGARLSGKAGGLHLGFLNMQTDELRSEDGDLQANNFGVARVAKELPNRSRVGGLFVQRRGTGSLAPSDDFNRTFAVDGRMGIGRHLDLSAFASRTETPGIDQDDHAFSFGASYSSRDWRWGAGYIEVGEGFNPEVGFLSRRGYRRPTVFVQRRFRPQETWGLLEIRPRAFYATYRDFDGFEQTGFFSFGTDLQWRSGFNLSGSVTRQSEGLRSGFTIAPGVDVPPGTYDELEARISLRTSRAKPLSGELRLEHGGFFGGDRSSLNASIALRLGDNVTSSISWNHNDVELPFGDFSTNLGRFRATYSFSTKLFLEALLQYNDRARATSTNLRFSWLHRANTGLFVVYNDQRFFSGTELPTGRSLIIKYSRVIDVFR